PTPSYFSPQGLALGDVDGDGRPDVVLEDNQAVDQTHPANVLVLLNMTGQLPVCGPTGVHAGVVDATGHFTPGPNGTCVATGNVDVNGINFDPTSGQIAIDPNAPSLSTSGDGTVRLGGSVSVWAWHGSITVPLGGTINLLYNTQGKLFGFPLAGSMTATLNKGD